MHPEFAQLDAGERIPLAPPWLRQAAWAFLALWLAACLVVFGYYLGKKTS